MVHLLEGTILVGEKRKKGRRGRKSFEDKKNQTRDNKHT